MSESDPSPTHAQLIALDLDGTVLSPTGHVTPRTRDAIRRVVDSGIRVCICTGRAWSESAAIAAEGGLTGPGVFVGGAMVHEMETGRVLVHERINPTICRDACAVIRSNGMAALAYQGGDHGDAEWLASAETELPRGFVKWTERFGSRVRRVPQIETFDHPYTVRVSTEGPIEQCDALAAAFVERFGPRVYLHQITIPQYNMQVVEIFDAAVDKWQGLLDVARLTDVDPRAIVAVGDDVNDLPMLRHAAVGIAMGNATPRVHEVAARTIGRNADDGLAVWLEEVVACRGDLAVLGRRD